MECTILRDEMIEVLYDEASPESERRLREHLAVCASCRDEMAALGRLRGRLKAWTPSPLAPRRADSWPQLGRWGRGLAVAAALLLALGAGLGLSGSELRVEPGRVAFRLGRGADLERALAEQEARHWREIEALRASLPQPAPGGEPAVLTRVQALLEESELRQARRLEGGLRDLGERAEAQRRIDLARVSAGLSYLDGKTGQHVARTNELMGYVLQAAERR